MKSLCFRHPTFEEYFAALAVGDLDFFFYREHKKKINVEDKDNPKAIRHRIFGSHKEKRDFAVVGLERKKYREEKEEFIGVELATGNDGFNG
jgi:hypothetical protein